MSTISVFSPTVINQLQEGSTQTKLSREDLIDDYPSDVIENSWKFDSPTSGFKSTQQLELDWTDFSQHTFFHSAEVKVNAAYERVINHFPFDGDAGERREFLDSMNGWEYHIFKIFPKYRGYLNFHSTNYISITDMEGYLYPALAKNSTFKNVVGKGSIDYGYTIECHYLPPDDSATRENQVIFQKLDVTGNNGITLAVSRSLGSSSTVQVHSLISSASGATVYKLHVSASLTKGKFSHIATVFDKGRSDGLHILVDGQIVDTTTSQLEMSNLDFLTSSLLIATPFLANFSSIFN